MFILITPEKLKLPKTAKHLRMAIEPFTSFSNHVVTYTAKNGHAIKKDQTVSTFLALLDKDVYEHTYVYTTNMPSADLMMAKLNMNHSCRVYITHNRFIDDVLPILDLMILTTSSRKAVEMDMWLPDEDSDRLEVIAKALRGKSLDVKTLIRQTYQFYNKNAPRALAEAKQLQRIVRQTDDKTTWIELSRNFIANQIRSRYITQYIRRYSAENLRQFEEGDTGALIA